MKIKDAVQYMTTQYLRRIIDSFTEDIPSKEEDEARKIIVQHTNDLADVERIKKRLKDQTEKYDERILRHFALEALLNAPDLYLKDQEIHEFVCSKEKAILDLAEDSECFEFCDDKAVDIMTTILEVAVHDNAISQDEQALIQRVRKKLDLSQKEQYLIFAQLGHFPKKGKTLHSYADTQNALLSLEKTGVVFHCNHHPKGSAYVLPEELKPGVKETLGMELNDQAWQLLLGNLTRNQLKNILDNTRAPVSGTKDQLIERVVRTGVKPSEALELLSTQELYDLLKKLPGATVGGNKGQRIDRVIEYFDNRTIREVPEDKDPRSAYYEYLVELSERDIENLRVNEIIKRERDIDSLFEEGTSYLFEEILGQDLLDLPGSDHPDGAVPFEKKDGILMWDNKSKEQEYRFPNTHLRQFARYIRESTYHVLCFLIIVPSIAEDAQLNMYELKRKAQSDTDVALIAAEDLKWVAENWRDYGDEFNLEVFNLTAILDRQMLEFRMQQFL
jgi:hypothetical protein